MLTALLIGAIVVAVVGAVLLSRVEADSAASPEEAEKIQGGGPNDVINF